MNINSHSIDDIKSDIENMSRRLERFRNKRGNAHTKIIDNECDYPRWKNSDKVPEINAYDLNVDTLRSAIATSGALIVRGLCSPEFCDKHLAIIDEMLLINAMSARNSKANSENVINPYKSPPKNLESLIKPTDLAYSRSFHDQSGSVMCIESSPIAVYLLGVYEKLGIKELVTEYFGEEPCLSAKKWVLRRSKLPISPTGWHQDGAFMGKDIDSINMWLTLSKCGGYTGAPGMDVFPVRLTDIIQASADSAKDWSVGNEGISKCLGGVSSVSPEFNAGDAFFFDHYYLHRTQYRKDFTSLRYAIETWFFSSRNFPKNQVPLSW
jgi:hypothetical protein